MIGRKAFHIFDRKKMTWICSTTELGYEKINDLKKEEPEAHYDDSDEEELDVDESDEDVEMMQENESI